MIRNIQIITIILIVVSVILWAFSLYFWFANTPGFEPVNVFISAIVSSLFALLGLLRTYGNSASANYIPEVVIGSTNTIDISSSAGHFRVLLKGKINFKKYGLPSDITLDNYRLYAFVHPLTTDLWYRQTPATANKEWQAIAHLGGKGQHSAKEGERFEIAIFISDADLKEQYKSVTEITQGNRKYISNI